MAFTRSWIAERFAKTNIIEQADFPGAKLDPSLTIYYDEYPYRLQIKGNSISRDIKLFADFEFNVLSQCMGNIRAQGNYKCHYLYIEYLSDLKMIFKNADPKMIEQFQSISGPLSIEHRDIIIGANEKIEVRKAKYWGKFDRKISFGFGYNIIDEAKTKSLREIEHFLKENLNDNEYLWYKRYNMYSTNFLYMTDTTWKEIGGYFILQFSDHIKENCLVIHPNDTL
jgi:hypothetical protein